jgi:phosphoesterase RecJ-like protein
MSSPLRRVAQPTVASVLAEAADARATVVLSGHVQPDADAIGSTLALAEGLRRRGARVLPTFPDPFVLPASLGWLPGADALVPSNEVPSSPEVFVSWPGCSRPPGPRWSSTTTPATPASATCPSSTPPPRPR